MNLIVKIAWRNIWRHRGKSVIIGAILFIGALLMTVGNGVISGMDAGLQKNIVEGFSGDAVIVHKKQESDNVFLEYMGKSVEPIDNYAGIDSVLRRFEPVKRWLPIGKNFAIALNEEGGMADGVFVLGVDWEQYCDFFIDNLKIVEGEFPTGRQRFVIIPTGWRKMYAEYYDAIITPEGAGLDTSTLGKEVLENISGMSFKHDVVYMGMSTENTTTDVRVTVRAIVKYRSLNTIWGMFPILDIESYRECLGYFSADDMAVTVEQQTLDLLSTSGESLDEMFSDESFVTTASGAAGDAQILQAGALAVVRDSIQTPVDLNAGTFNLVLVRFEKSGDLDRQVRQLNEALSAGGVDARAIAWNKAIGMIGSMALLIKSILFAFVMCLFFVAIIIIMNTLSMAAIERTTEIGMMRAVGARKGFIRSMFLGETAVLSAVFGGAGILTGIVIVNIVAGMHLTTDIDMLQLLYGGDTFRPILSVIDIAMAVLQLVIVTFLAVIYPIAVASGITPLDAISRE